MTATTSYHGEDRILISGLTYEFYKLFCDEIGEQRVWLSFVDDTLEIMKVHPMHIFYNWLLSRIVNFTAVELEIPMGFGGSITIQRDDLKVALEPDDSWWFASLGKIGDRFDLDFRRDPPPDLAIEVELNKCYLGRVSILEAIGIPEVWWFDGTNLRFLILNPEGKYVDSERSNTFPFLKRGDLLAYLAPPNEIGQMSRIRAYIDWLKTQNITWPCSSTKPNPA